MYFLKKLQNCGMFQGENRRSHYFEGWYFKHVDARKENVISIIPGISLEDSRDKSHAFIQVINGNTHETYYVRYDIKEFDFSKKDFEIRIADNIFNGGGIELNMKDKDLTVQGRLSYTRHVEWPSTLLSPNSMGWYAYIPVMECYHGVLSMKHMITGDLRVNERSICYDKGIGYIEKDWGTSFPSSWIWLQSNHFEEDDASLMLSIARIPWRGRSFTGFIAGLWHEDRLYRFTTYTGAKIDYLKYEGNHVRMKLSDKRFALVVEGWQGNTGALLSPVKGAMAGSVLESVNASANIRIYDVLSNKLLFNRHADLCGMEIAGSLHELLT